MFNKLLMSSDKDYQTAAAWMNHVADSCQLDSLPTDPQYTVLMKELDGLFMHSKSLQSAHNAALDAQHKVVKSFEAMREARKALHSLYYNQGSLIVSEADIIEGWNPSSDVQGESTLADQACKDAETCLWESRKQLLQQHASFKLLKLAFWKNLKVRMQNVCNLDLTHNL